MKVLIVTTWFPSALNPESGIFVLRDAELLAHDHDVEVVHLCSGQLVGTARPEGLPSHIVLTRKKLNVANLGSQLRAARWLRKKLRGFDIVHTMSPSSLLPMMWIRMGRPWVHTEHWSGILAPETLPISVRAALPLTLRIMERPDVVVAVGEALAAALALHRKGPIRVVPNSVSLSHKLVSRESSSIATNIISVGGLIPRKGPLIALQTVQLLRSRGHDARLRWVGSGPLLQQLIEHTHRLGLEDFVEWSGAVGSDKVLTALGKADIFLLPTTSETFGVAIAEALASGRPVVVGARGGHTEFVNEPDGVLVQTQDAEAYAAGVLRVLKLNNGRSAADIASGVRQRFNESNRAASYRLIYSEAIERARA